MRPPSADESRDRTARRIGVGERTPVRGLDELYALDEAEMQEGYWDGRAGEPEPGDNRSKAYWHGWRVGMMDAGRLPIDADHRKLVAEFASDQRRAARERPHD